MADALAILIANFEAASAVFEAAPAVPNDPTELAFNDALTALDTYTPRTADEFVRAFVARFSDELLATEDDFAELVTRARAIVSANG